jgi:hypothetical protein
MSNCRDTEHVLDDLLLIFKKEKDEDSVLENNFKKPKVVKKIIKCQPLFDSSDNLKRRRHSLKRSYQGVTDGESFKRQHLELSSCACLICGVIFTHSFLKEIHQCIVKIVKTFKCKFCNQRFSSQHSTQFHQFMEHEMIVRLIGMK